MRFNDPKKVFLKKNNLKVEKIANTESVTAAGIQKLRDAKFLILKMFGKMCRAILSYSVVKSSFTCYEHMCCVMEKIASLIFSYFELYLMFLFLGILESN